MEGLDVEHPYVFDNTDPLCDLVVANHQAHQARLSQKLHRAIMLAPNIQVCEALLRGEPVPRTQLDPLWAKRYGL